MSAGKTKEKTSAGHKILTVIGIILCVILIPILAMNITLLIKSYTDKEAVPDVGGVLPLIVLTDSMYPEIHSGDIIICRTAKAESIKAGDVISFFDPESENSSVVTHRVKEVTEEDGEIAWVTKGDNNNVEDKAIVPSSKLVGKWTGIRAAGLGNVAIFMQTTPGLIVCVVLPLVLLIGYDIIRRKAYEKKQTKDNDELMAELEELRRLKAERESEK